MQGYANLWGVGAGGGGGQIRCIMGDVQAANCWFAADASAAILLDKTKSVSLSLGTLFSSKLGKKKCVVLSTNTSSLSSD